MSTYFDSITSPLRRKAAPRSQSYPVNALSEQEISKGSSDMLQERTTPTNASNNLFYAYARRVSLIFASLNIAIESRNLPRESTE